MTKLIQRGVVILNTQEKFQQLQAQDWADISKRLMLYAIKRAQRYGGLYRGDFALDDVVQEVILKTLSDERKWDPSKGPLFQWLKYQINSVMNHWINDKSGKHETSFADNDLDEEAGEKSSSIEVNDVEDIYAVEPEIELLDNENAKLIPEQVKLLFEAIRNDSELEQLVEYFMENGEQPPRFIAKDLGTTVTDINNRKKRLYRHIDTIDSLSQMKRQPK